MNDWWYVCFPCLMACNSACACAYSYHHLWWTSQQDIVWNEKFFPQKSASMSLGHSANMNRMDMVITFAFTWPLVLHYLNSNHKRADISNRHVKVKACFLPDFSHGMRSFWLSKAFIQFLYYSPALLLVAPSRGSNEVNMKCYIYYYKSQSLNFQTTRLFLDFWISSL